MVDENRPGVGIDILPALSHKTLVRRLRNVSRLGELGCLLRHGWTAQTVNIIILALPLALSAIVCRYFLPLIVGGSDVI
jgi:hypothetical protein